MLERIFGIIEAALAIAGETLPSVVPGKAGALVALALRVTAKGLEQARFVADNAGELTAEDMAAIEADLIATEQATQAKIDAAKARKAAQA